jgi:hypothetical protein
MGMLDKILDSWNMLFSKEKVKVFTYNRNYVYVERKICNDKNGKIKIHVKLRTKTVLAPFENLVIWSESNKCGAL